MGIDQYWDAAMAMKKQPKGADDPPYSPPAGHDHEMSVSERDGLTTPFIAAHKRRLRIKPANALIGEHPCGHEGQLDG